MTLGGQRGLLVAVLAERSKLQWPRMRPLLNAFAWLNVRLLVCVSVYVAPVEIGVIHIEGKPVSGLAGWIDYRLKRRIGRVEIVSLYGENVEVRISTAIEQFTVLRMDRVPAYRRRR